MASLTENRPADVYVGPRPYETGERLYGRDHEVTALTSLLIGERLVLLYSPSGAGKTSLIQAGLVPAMRDEEFFIPAISGAPSPRTMTLRELAQKGSGATETGEKSQRPTAAVVVRVSTPRPPGVPASVNRYLLSMLLSLETHRPESERRPVAVLARLNLAEYLAAEFPIQPTTEGDLVRPLVLLFDQFEEALTLDPTDIGEKRAFFSQLGEVLKEPLVWNEGPRLPRRWALFAIREDHLAGLEPYLPYLPTQLAARYRLDRLAPAEALQSVVGPAAEVGIEFDPAAARALVENLAMVRVQQDDNSFLDRPGPHVEPVYLQVVCRKLWSGLQPGQKRIESADIAPRREDSSGSFVGQALEAYYEEQVKLASDTSGVSERRIRDWFDKELITAADARKPVQRGEEQKFGITSACLVVLDKAYLVRSDPRGGAIWLELAHDRMIVPIRRNNAAWRQANLSDTQKRAAQWDATGRLDHLLLAGTELSAAEKWAADRQWALSEVELQFLKDSRRKYDELEQRHMAEVRLETYRRRVRVAIIGMGIFTFLAISATVGYYRLKEFRNGVEADADRVANKKIQEAKEKENARSKDQSILRQMLLDLRTKPATEGHTALARAREALEFAQQKKLDTMLAEAELRAASRVVDWHELTTQGGPARVSAFSKDGKSFATGSEEGRVRWWNTDDTGFPTGEPRVLIQPTSRGPGTGGGGGGGGGGTGPRMVTALAFHPQQAYLASGGEDGSFWVWSVNSTRPVATFEGGTAKSATRRIVFSENGAWVLSTHADGTLKLLRWPSLADGQETPIKTRELQLQNGIPITAAVFTPFPRKVYAGAADGMVWSWNTDDPSPPMPVKQRPDLAAVAALAVSPDANLFAVGTVGTTVSLFGMSPFSKVLQPGSQITLGRFGLLSLAFSSNTVGKDDLTRTGWLAGVTVEGRVKLWNVKDISNGNSTVPLRGADAVRVTELAFSPGQSCRWLLAGGIDGAGRLWDLTDTRRAPYLLSGHASAIVQVGFSPNARWATTTGQDGRVRFWDLTAYAAGVRTEPATYPRPPKLGAVDINRDGSRVAIANGTELQEFGPDGRLLSKVNTRETIEAVSFDVGSNRVQTATDTGGLAAWDAIRPNVEPVIKRAGTHVKRPNDEWEFVSGGRAILGPNHANLLTEDLTAKPVTYAANTPTGGLRASGTGQLLQSKVTDRIITWELDAEGRLDPVRMVTIAEIRKDLQLTQEVIATDVHPDGRTLAVGCLDGTVALYPLPPAKPVALRGHADTARVVRFSPDGRRLATGGGDGSVRLWDITEGLDLSRSMVLVGHDRLIRAIKFSADGGTVLTVSDDGTVKAWSVTLDRLLERTKAIGR